MTRYLDRIGRVWDAISTTEQFDLVGFCLDTCHAHAGGNALETVVDDVRQAHRPHRPVHCNDSRDEFDSGADRHANLGAGQVDADLLAAVVRDAGAPVVLETRAARPSTPPTPPGCARASRSRPAELARRPRGPPACLRTPGRREWAAARSGRDDGIRRTTKLRRPAPDFVGRPTKLADRALASFGAGRRNTGDALRRPGSDFVGRPDRTRPR